MADPRILRAALLLAVAALAACAHGPGESTALASRGRAARALPRPSAHPPYGRLAIVRILDERPGHEYGQTNYLRHSWVSTKLYDRPLPAMLRGLLTRALAEGGAFTPTEDETAADYFLDVRVRHFYGRYDTNILALTLIVPSISVEAEIEMGVKLSDGDGRRLLEKVYRKKDDAVAPAVAGAHGTAQELLDGMLGEILAELVAESDAGVARFWQDLGLPVPAPR